MWGYWSISSRLGAGLHKAIFGLCCFAFDTRHDIVHRNCQASLSGFATHEITPSIGRARRIKPQMSTALLSWRSMPALLWVISSRNSRNAVSDSLAIQQRLRERKWHFQHSCMPLNSPLIRCTLMCTHGGVYTCNQGGGAKFRQQIARFLESDTPVAVTRRGETLGVYVPTPRRSVRAADMAELRAAADRLAAALSGVDEEEIAAEFKQTRRARKAGKR